MRSVCRRLAPVLGLWSGAAWAGDTELWFGGSLDTGAVVARPNGGTAEPGAPSGTAGVGFFFTQIEGDFRLVSGPVYVRVDLDAHFDLNHFKDGVTFPWAQDLEWTQVPNLLVAPLPPEEAFVQFGRQDVRLRLGVSNPEMGYQEWDAFNNDLPSFALTWELQNGQIAGLHPAFTVKGTDIGAFGGWDMGWGTWTGGAWVAAEGEQLSTWSGVAVWPELGYYAAFPAVSWTPVKPVALTLDGVAAVAGGKGLGGGQLLLALFPEELVHGALRVEGVVDPAHAQPTVLELYGRPDWGAGAVVSADFIPMLHIAVEGKVQSIAKELRPVGILYVAVRRPEPDEDKLGG